MKTSASNAMRVSGRRKFHNGLMAFLVGLGTLIVLGPLFIILYYVIAEGIGALNWAFFTQAPAPPGDPGGGMLPAIVGTLIIDLLALVIGGLFGLAAGILLAEYPDHRLNPVLRLVTDVMAGVPAILMGLVAYALLVRPMGGFSAISGSVALALLMIPIIARSTEGMLRLIPWELREAGLALGLPRWRVTLSLILPAARGGIITGLMLALARAAGEAAPLLFTAFGNNSLVFNPLMAMDTLPLKLYNYAISPYPDWHAKAWGAALVLVALIMITSLLARWATRGRSG
jgi:phosphate transport system permease protein